MPKIDLTGQRFGRLTVIKENPIRSNDGHIRWDCICDCGNKITVASNNLKKKKGTKSCGCLNKEIVSEIGKKSKIDLAGQRFGKLTVLEDSGERQGKSIKWKCKCDCGNEVIVDGHSLRRGYTQSCGCSIRSKGEQAIEALLMKNNFSFKREKTFETCRFKDTNYLARFDFYVNEKYIIEFDGEQHYFYRNNNGWSTKEKFKKTQEHDKFKNQWCKENNIPLIRIPYTYLKDLSIEDLKLETSKFIVR